MKLSEIKEDLVNLSVSHKTLFINILLAEITVMNRCFWGDDSIDDSEKINGLKWSNELVHRLQNIQFKLESFDDHNTIDSIFDNIDFNKKQSNLLSSHIHPTVVNAYNRFNRIEHSWDYELDIDSQNRYLVIWCKILTEGNPGLKLQNNEIIDLKKRPNILSVAVDYSYGNIELPKTYDIIFDRNDLSRFWECKTIVLATENSRKIHWDLWRGHHSRCFIEVLGELPNIFDELPILGEKTKTYPCIGLCSKYDWKNIKKKNMKKVKTS